MGFFPVASFSVHQTNRHIIMDTMEHLDMSNPMRLGRCSASDRHPGLGAVTTFKSHHAIETGNVEIMVSLENAHLMIFNLCINWFI